MTKSVAEKLSDLTEAVRSLSAQAQKALVDAQRAEIDRRLASPRYADPARVRELFARFGVRAD
jgi:phage gp36-like protein